MRLIDIAVPAALALAPAAAIAQENNARFALEKSADGFVRMDRVTGEMSICQETSGQLVCKMAADDRTAFENELDRMQENIDALSKRVAILESAPRSLMPTDEEFDQTMTYMQRFFRGFMDIVKEWDRDLRGNEPEPPPQRT
jgi:hypothetical protein